MREWTASPTQRASRARAYSLIEELGHFREHSPRPVSARPSPSNRRVRRVAPPHRRGGGGDRHIGIPPTTPEGSRSGGGAALRPTTGSPARPVLTRRGSGPSQTNGRGRVVASNGSTGGVWGCPVDPARCDVRVSPWGASVRFSDRRASRWMDAIRIEC